MSVDVAGILRRLVAGEDLSKEAAAAMIGAMMDGTVTDAQSAAFLTALAKKGETEDELTGAAGAMRDRSLRVEHGLPLVMDVVGSGGDGAGTINISTIAALVVAAAGVPVAKHGNRAASGQCGTADVLEAGGMAIEVSPKRAAESLREVGFAFMFAPIYHPAMKNVAHIRRELGFRTIFNMLGPLTNPARATHQLVGVAREEHLEPVGDVLRALGVRAGAVVHASSGIDEVGGEGPTAVYEFGEGSTKRWTLDPGDYGVRASLEEIRGGAVVSCREAFESILAGERSPRADVVALNAALAFRLCGKTADIKEGMDLARTQLQEGRAAALFERAKHYSHG
ncbi:MAG TPA: anthranilate phosphoribosyltransferase [Candidatus Rubrimentiphilum sp.]|nr:anthranilate phosphoribosyltransferase [Candidatus Rubrimentiphilum sp.]